VQRCKFADDGGGLGLVGDVICVQCRETSEDLMWDNTTWVTRRFGADAVMQVPIECLDMRGVFGDSRLSEEFEWWGVGHRRLSVERGV